MCTEAVHVLMRAVTEAVHVLMRAVRGDVHVLMREVTEEKCPCTHVTLLALVELLLVPVLQNLLHHPAALPHAEHRLPMLVAHILQAETG